MTPQRSEIKTREYKQIKFNEHIDTRAEKKRPNFMIYFSLIIVSTKSQCHQKGTVFHDKIAAPKRLLWQRKDVTMTTTAN